MMSSSHFLMDMTRAGALLVVAVEDVARAGVLLVEATEDMARAGALLVEAIEDIGWVVVGIVVVMVLAPLQCSQRLWRVLAAL